MKLPKHKCGLYITHNEHLDIYQPIIEAVGEVGDEEWATKDSRERAIETNSLWSIQWYPDTPIGFCKVYGATLSETLKAAGDYYDSK